MDMLVVNPTRNITPTGCGQSGRLCIRSLVSVTRKFLLALLLLPGIALAAPFAYISNGNDNTVSVIDTASNSVVATVGVGDNPIAFGLFIGPGLGAGGGTVSIPRLPEWGLIILSSLLALGAFGALRRMQI
jgi:YVTN family beta-propeller protein